MRSCFLLLFLILFLPGITFSQSTIPFQLLPSGHILVPASIDGITGSFIFDTGAGLTVLTKKFFDRLKQTAPVDGGFTAFRATGERLDVDLYTVRDFKLGNLHKTVSEISYLDVDLGGADGIISLKLMEQQPFTIDFDKKVIRLETPQQLAAIRKAGRIVPLQLEQSHGKALDMFAYFRVNDTLTLQFSLDSGAGKDVYRINSKYLQRLGIDAGDTTLVRKKERKSEINAAFTSSIYFTTVKKIAAAAAPGINVINVPAQFVDGLIYDGIMWINWLAPRITIDIPGEQLIL
jgi:hypothetical protein